MLREHSQVDGRENEQMFGSFSVLGSQLAFFGLRSYKSMHREEKALLNAVLSQEQLWQRHISTPSLLLPAGGITVLCYKNDIILNALQGGFYKAQE